MHPKNVRLSLIVALLVVGIMGIGLASVSAWTYQPIEPKDFRDYVNEDWYKQEAANWTTTPWTSGADQGIFDPNWAVAAATSGADPGIFNPEWAVAGASSGSDPGIFGPNWVPTKPSYLSDPFIL